MTVWAQKYTEGKKRKFPAAFRGWSGVQGQDIPFFFPLSQRKEKKKRKKEEKTNKLLR